MGRVREPKICLVARLGCLTETGEIMKTIVGVCQEELLQRVTWQFEIVDLAGASHLSGSGRSHTRSTAIFESETSTTLVSGCSHNTARTSVSSSRRPIWRSHPLFRLARKSMVSPWCLFKELRAHRRTEIVRDGVAGRNRPAEEGGGRRLAASAKEETSSQPVAR
jgi:hypothetical protein